MLRKLPIRIVKNVFMLPFFREEDLSDEEWLAWKIRCARNLGFKGEFNKEEMLASRGRPIGTENQSKPTKEAE